MTDLLARLRTHVDLEEPRLESEVIEAWHLLHEAATEIERLRDALEWYSTAIVTTSHPRFQRYYGWPDDGHYARVTLGKEKPVIVCGAADSAGESNG